MVLVIIFMVVAPAMVPCFAPSLPKAQNSRTHAENTADQILAIDRDGTYYLNKRPIPRDTLRSMLSAIFAARSHDRVLYVRADKDLSYATVLETLAIARQSGVLVAGLISEATPQTTNQGSRRW